MDHTITHSCDLKTAHLNTLESIAAYLVQHPGTRTLPPSTNARQFYTEPKITMDMCHTLVEYESEPMEAMTPCKVEAGIGYAPCVAKEDKGETLTEEDWDMTMPAWTVDCENEDFVAVRLAMPLAHRGLPVYVRRRGNCRPQ